MSDKKIIQPWVAEVCWPGRKKFFVGTFFVEYKKESREEILKKALEAYKKGWGACLPIDVPLPDVIQLRPGALLFVTEDEWNSRED